MKTILIIGSCRELQTANSTLGAGDGNKDGGCGWGWGGQGWGMDRKIGVGTGGSEMEDRDGSQEWKARMRGGRGVPDGYSKGMAISTQPVKDFSRLPTLQVKVILAVMK